MSCEYVREYYNVPAEIGRKVTVGGKPGIITEDRGHYIGVVFDNDPKLRVLNCHPTSDVIYGEMGELRKLSRSQMRYREWVRSDCGLTFAEFIGIIKK